MTAGSTPKAAHGVVAKRRLPVAVYPLVPLLVLVIGVWREAVLYPADLWRPLLIALGLGLAITLLSRVASGDRDLGAIAAFAIAAAVVVTDPRLSLPLIAIAMVVIALARFQRRQIPVVRTLSGILEVIGIALLLISLVTTAVSGAGTRAMSDLGRRSGSIGASVADSQDIYLIMLDGYPGPEAAKQAPWFDEQAFPDALRKRGFEVVEGAHSNYPWTALTLAAMFANRHLTPDDDDRARLQRLISDGRTLAELRRVGYETIAVSSGYNGVDLHLVDRTVSPPQPDGLEIAILRSTVIGPLLDELAPGVIDGLQRDRIEETFEAVVNVSEETHAHPRFVFAHVPAPHGPWVFGPTGEPRTEGLEAFYSDSPAVRGISDHEALRRSFDQATYIGHRTIEMLDRLFSRIDPNATVVVFSDHGPRLVLNPPDPSDQLSTRASNLIAIRAPRHPGLLPVGTTPINIIPRILDAEAGARLDILPDVTQVWTRAVGQ